MNMTMTMTQNDVQSDVILRILQRYFAGDDLESAVDLWHQQYRYQSLDKLSYFVFEITTTSTLRNMRQQIIDDLTQGLQHRAPFSADLIAKSQQGGLDVQQPKNNWATDLSNQEKHKGVEYFFEQILSCLQSQSKQEVYQLSREYLQETKLPAQVTADFMTWHIDRQNLGCVIEHVGYIQQIVNVLYRILCEYFGPMKSDRHLSQAIGQTVVEFPMLPVKQFL